MAAKSKIVILALYLSCNGDVSKEHGSLKMCQTRKNYTSTPIPMPIIKRRTINRAICTADVCRTAPIRVITQDQKIDSLLPFQSPRNPAEKAATVPPVHEIAVLRDFVAVVRAE
jgi:hypothetical protein